MRLSRIAVAALFVLACGRNEAPSPASPAAPSSSSSPSGNLIINGAGATFPYPIYSKWFAEYQTLHPNVQVNYQSIGSGGGIKQLSAGTVFFGASDGPMTDAQLKAAPSPILHFPTVLGGVVPIYNVEGVSQPLRFTGKLLADLFLGHVTSWNDPAIAAANPGVKLPAEPIVIVHRSDGSGTNYIFCDFLAKISPEFRSRVGVSTSVSWPAGVGGKGNEGVSGMVRQTPGALGYVELIYALQNRIPFGSVQNKAGNFVPASLESVTAAAADAASAMPEDFRISITDAGGANAYPIASFTWMLFSQNPSDKARARAMVDFMKWALADGQKDCPALGYAPLPPDVVQKEIAALAKIQL